MDITALGIALDTSDLKQGESALNSAADAANKAADAFDAIGESASNTAAGASKLASQYTGLSQASTEAAANSQKYLAALKQEYDLLGLNRGETEAYIAQTKGMTAAEQQLAAALGAKIDAWNRDEAAAKASAAAQDRAAASADQFIAKLQAQASAAGKTRTELLQMQAAQLGVSQQAAPLISQIEGASTATGHLGGSTAAARREIIVLAHEMATGNWTRFGGSVMVLGEQFDVLGKLMSPIGIGIGAAVAGIAALAVAAVKGAAEMKEFNGALTLTGNYAGLTRDSFEKMAESVSGSSGSSLSGASAVLLTLAKSGRYTSDEMSALANVILQTSQVSGDSLKDVEREYAKLADDPAKWAAEHNKSMHFMDEATIQHIKVLQDMGDKHQAVQAVIEAATAQVENSSNRHLSAAAQAWRDLSREVDTFWVKIKQGMSSGPNLQDQIDNLKEQRSAMAQAGGGFSSHSISDIDNQIANLEAFKQNEQRFANQQSQNDQKQQGLGVADKYLNNGSHMTQAEQLKKQLAEEDAAYKAAIAGAQGNQALMEQIESAHNDRMEALETKHQKKARDNTQNFLSAQLTDLDGQRKLVEQGLTDHLANLSKQHSAGRISDQSFIDQEYQSRNDALQKELAIAAQEETIAEGKKQLSAAEKYKNDIATIKQKIAENEQNHVDAIADMHTKSEKAYLDSIDKQIDAADKQDQTLRDQIDTFGMTKTALDQLNVARADEAVATMEADRAERLRNDDMADTKVIDARINKEKELAATLRGVATDQATLDDKNQAKKQQDDLIKTWQGTIDGIGTDFHNGFLQMLGDGKKGWASFTDSLKNTFETTVVNELYKAFAKPMVISVIAQIAGIAGGSDIQNQILQSNGMAGSSNQLNNLSNAYSTLTKGYGYVSGLFGAGGYGSAASAIGGAAGTFGASSIGAFGALSTTGSAAAAAAADGALAGSAALGGIAGSTTAGVGAAAAGVGGGAAASTAGAGAASAGLSAASAIPVIGWILAGMALDSKMMAQGWNPDNGSMSGAGKVLGSATMASYDLAKAIGIPSGIANILTGASTFSRLFGRKDPTVDSAGVDGHVTVANGFQGQDYTDWTAKGGFFRGDAHGTVNTPATQDQIGMINGTVIGTVAVINQLSGAIGGIDGLQGKLSAFNYSIRNDWRDQTNVTKSLTDLSNGLVEAIVPLDQYQQSGETLTQTAVRLTGVFNSTNTLADLLGKTMTQAFGAVGIAGTQTRLNLIAAAGGIDSFNTEVSAYVKAYYSNSEQLSQATSQMTQTFASMGLALPKSKDGFRDVVTSLDLTTAAGQNTFAALMALAPAFDQYTQAMKQAADAQQALWDQYFSAVYTPTQQLAMNTKQLQDKFDALGVAMPKTNADFQTLVENMNTSSQPAKDLQNALLALAPSFAQVTSAADQATQAAQQAAAQNLQTALGNVQTAYDTQSKAIQANIDSINQFISSLTNLKQSLSLGSLSTLSPQDKYLAEKQLFESTSASAAAGDATAQGNLPQVAQDFLTASQAYNASSQAYVNDYNEVQKSLDANIATAQQQLSAAQQQLNATNQMVQGILNLNQTTQSLADALKAYFAAGGTASSAAAANTYGGAAGSNLNAAQVQATAVNGLIPYSAANPFGPMGGNSVSDWQGSAGWLTPSDLMAIADQARAQSAAINGSHAGGLDSVPFDGYRAELHKGEAVVTSANNQKLSQMLNIDWSRFGGNDQAALLNEIKALRAEVAATRQSQQQIAAAQMQHAEQLHVESKAELVAVKRNTQSGADATSRLANRPLGK